MHFSDNLESAIGQSLAFEEWIGCLGLELSGDDRARLHHAWQWAAEVYGEHRRPSGETYFAHALAVSIIVAGLRIDVDTVIAALLHDLPLFEGRHRERLDRELGESLGGLVGGVARIAVVSGLHRQPEAGSGDEGPRAEALRRMLLAMAKDIRVVFIALAERLHDMRVLPARSSDVRTTMARETIELYAPLANRLGIWQLKWQLEDLSFRYLEPDVYKRIAGLLAEKRRARERYIENVQRRLSRALGDAGIDAEITGRPKHILSIWRKMRRKNLDFQDVFDIRAFRVLVSSVPQCYAALGVVHALWQPIPKEFDDYIATPKENSYQSLHTAVLGPEGKGVEVQIRTREMHRHAELGIAAHWRYKEGIVQNSAFDTRIAWLRALLEAAPDEGEHDDLIDRFQAEVFADRVYVITPQGDIVDLPSGATPLDFAYQIHSEVGHRCRGAKVDGRIVPLSHRLNNGERVEILTARNGSPSRDWLNPELGYLRTPRARAKARTWFRQQDFDNNLAEGRRILDRELHRLGLADVSLERVAARSKRFPKLDDFLAAIGRGDISGGQIAGLVAPDLLPAREPTMLPSLRRGADATARGRADDDVSVYGVGNLLTRMAGCCQPAPGDAIVGFITRGAGVTIHRRGCSNLAHLAQEAGQRVIEVSWNDGRSQRYTVDVVVEAYDRQGLIKDVSAVLNNEHANVLAVNTHTDPTDQQARMRLRLEISDVAQMRRVMERIAGLRNVRDVRRIPPGSTAAETAR